MKQGVFRSFLMAVITVCGSQLLLAQYTVQHQQPTILERNEVNTLTFYVSGINEGDVLEALLFFRNEGELGFSQKEVFFTGGNFTATLNPAELTGTSLEYYFQLSLRGANQDIYFPGTLPSENPVEVDIIEVEEEQRPKAEGIDYTIISPKPENGLAVNDVYIAIALYYNPEEIESGEFRLFINDLDVTSQADTSDFFISYVPKGLKRGNQTVRLDYVTENEQLEVVQWDFNVVDPRRANVQSLQPRLIPTGRAELTARNQIIAGDLNNAYTARTYLSGSYGLFRYSLNAFLTTQESSRLQPQNRFAAEMSFGKWWDFKAGHVYPNLSRFTISGRRIFGINTSLHVLKENLNVQFVYGELSRKVTNLYGSVRIDTVYASAEQDSIVDKTYTLQYEDLGRGTFSRKVIGGRVGFGNPRKFQFGVQAMKVEDDTTSIFNVLNYNDLLQGDPSLYQNLSQADRARLAGNPDLLSIEGGSPRPKGNFVAGADLRFSLAQNKVRFQTETVASVLNDDIYGGPLDSLRAADLGFEDIDQGPLDILQQISQFIIINENVTVLPIRFTNFNTDSSDVEMFFPTSILGSNSELVFNYPKNSLSVQYRWVGPEFVSLANSTIRKDIAGFTITDRFRLMSNQIYVTLGLESLRDNVSNTKESTTNTNSYRTNISWSPVRQMLPRLSAGFRYRTRSNDIERFNPLVSEFVDSLGNDISANRAVQNLRINEDGNTLTTTTPRMNNTVNLNFSATQRIPLLDMVHYATLSISTLRTIDDVFAYGDVKNTSVSLNIASEFETLPLRTQLGLNVNHTQAGAGQLEIDILGMYLSGSYFMFNGKLNVNGRLAFTSNTSKSRQIVVANSEDQDFFNDYYDLSDEIDENNFGTYVFVAGAEYKLNNSHSFVFDSNFTNVTGSNFDNDRVVQLRYIYRF